MNIIAIVTITKVAARVRSAIQPMHQRKHHGERTGNRDEQERLVPGLDTEVREHETERVGAESEERGVSERDVPGVAAHDVPRGGEADVHRGEHRDVDGRGIGLEDG